MPSGVAAAGAAEAAAVRRSDAASLPSAAAEGSGEEPVVVANVKCLRRQSSGVVQAVQGDSVEARVCTLTWMKGDVDACMRVNV
jgi:hypothetical protein